MTTPAASIPPERPRETDTTLAQVVFADCRAPGPTTTSPGWKVKDVAVAPGTRAPEREVLEAVESVAQVHHADLALAAAGRSVQVPATFKQLRLPGEVMLLANFADAGLDRTGRASHTVHGILHDGLLRAADGVVRRPVELLDSPMWLRPVGQDAVEALTVAGRGFDLPRGPVELDAVSGDAFLTDVDHPERIEALPLVLEGFRGALEEGATLALVAPGRDEVVGWLALLQTLLDPVSAGRLRFSTREDLHGDAADLQVVGVTTGRGLQGALPDSLDPRLIVVDVVSPPAPLPGGGWPLPGGSVMHRSLWTDVAELVLSSPRSARLVRQTLDDLGASAAPTVVAGPLWALPLASLVAGVETIDPAALLGVVVRNWPVAPVPARAAADAVARTFRELHRADPTVAADLAGGVGPGVPERLADDILGAWARDVVSEPGAPAVGRVWPRRRLSEAEAASLGRELPALLGWLDGAPGVVRGAALVRVWNAASAVGVPAGAVAAAVRPFSAPVVDALLDAAFDPTAAGWPPMPVELWRAHLAPAVHERLVAADGRVADATHRYLEPALDDRDRPEAAARARRLDLSAYGWHRAATMRMGPTGTDAGTGEGIGDGAAAADGAGSETGTDGTAGAARTGAGPADPWLAAVVAAARGRTLAREPGRSVSGALSTALREAFGDRPPPTDVARALLADLPPGELDGAMVVASRTLVGSDGGEEYRAIAAGVWARLSEAGDEERTDAGLVYLHVVLDALVEGGPEAAADPSVCAAAEYLAGTVLPPLPESRIRAIGWSVVLGWLLRVPVAVLRSAADDTGAGDTASPHGTTYGATVSGLLGGADIPTATLDGALDAVLRRAEPAVARRILANLVVRTGLVFLDWSLPARDEPLAVYLRLSAAGNVSRFMREPVVAWLETQPPTEIEELRRAVGDVVYGLADLGWGREEVRYLEEDREQLFAMLHNRNLLGRVRAPR